MHIIKKLVGKTVEHQMKKDKQAKETWREGTRRSTWRDWDRLAEENQGQLSRSVEAERKQSQVETLISESFVFDTHMLTDQWADIC